MFYRFAVLTFALALAVAADAATGNAGLKGMSKVGVRGCGAKRLAFSGTVTVLDDGTWSARSDEGDGFAGTYRPAGRTGRKLLLAFDTASLAAFVGAVEDDVAALCESPPATVTAVRPKALSLAVNRKLTKAKLVLRYAFTGNAGGRSGTATYKLVARGPWTPG
jgi:hypothetical protein